MNTFLIADIADILQGIGFDIGIFPVVILTTLITTFIIIYFIFLLASIIVLIVLKNDKKISTNIPSVSVVVAIRNGEKSISRLINKLLSQSYSGNVEFILVDDQSNDNTSFFIKDTLAFLAKDLISIKLLFKEIDLEITEGNVAE